MSDLIQATKSPESTEKLLEVAGRNVHVSENTLAKAMILNARLKALKEIEKIDQSPPFGVIYAQFVATPLVTTTLFLLGSAAITGVRSLRPPLLSSNVALGLLLGLSVSVVIHFLSERARRERMKTRGALQAEGREVVSAILGAQVIHKYEP